MSIARTAADLGSIGAQRPVEALGDHLARDGAREGGPAASGIELVGRGEQRLAAGHVHVDAWFERAVVGVAEGRLGSVHARNAVLVGRQHAAQLVVGGGGVARLADERVHVRICKAVFVARPVCATRHGRRGDVLALDRARRRGALAQRERFAQPVHLHAGPTFLEAHALGERVGAADVDMAVAARVLLEVVLVVLLGGVEAVERLHLGDDGARIARLLAQQRRLDGGQVGLVGPIDARAVLGAAVVSLTVDRRGVDGLEEGVQQHVGGQHARVVGYGHGFGVTRVPATYVVIAGVLGGTVRVADDGSANARQSFQIGFEPPEASSGKIQGA